MPASKVFGQSTFGEAPAAPQAPLVPEPRNLESQAQASLLGVLLAHAPAAIALFDRELRYLACSQRWISDLRTANPDIIGRSHYELFPDIPQRWKDVHGRCLAGAIESCAMDEYPRSDGTVDWLRWEVRPWRDAHDEIGGLIMMCEVVTARVRAEAALRDSERQQRALIDNLPGAVYRVRNDPDYTAEYVSPAIERLTGHPPEAILGGAVTLASLMHPDDRARVWRETQDGLATSGRYAVEFRIRRADGEERWLADNGSGICGDGGAPQALEGIVLDVTGLRRAQAASRESALRLQSIVRAASIGLWDWDIVTNAVYFSPEWKRQLGHEDHEIGADLAEWERRVHPDDLPLAREKIRRYLADPDSLYQNETRMRHKDGTWRWMLVAAALDRGADGTPLRMLGAHIDVTERRVAGERLAAALAHAQALNRRLVEVQEFEQRRLSAELHDRIGQNLTALRIDLKLLGGALPPPLADQLSPRLHDSQALIDATVAAIRGLITELRPAVLEDYGLLAGLRALGQEFEARSGIVTAVAGDEPVPRLAPPVELALYRIAQEALTNTVRHAHARRVSVGLAATAGGTELCIADDGDGFDPQAAAAGPRTHWGLAMMRERAEAVGARLSLASAPGQGTRVTVGVERAA